MNSEREHFESGITILGLVAFENKLKSDARELIQRLRTANIDTKMITGDSIYVAAETAIRSGIIPQESAILLIEGRKQQQTSDSISPGPRVFHATSMRRHGEQVLKETVELAENGDYLRVHMPAVVDNDFLNLNPPPALTPSMKVFSRISPEAKSRIVAHYKR